MCVCARLSLVLWVFGDDSGYGLGCVMIKVVIEVQLKSLLYRNYCAVDRSDNNGCRDCLAESVLAVSSDTAISWPR